MEFSLTKYRTSLPPSWCTCQRRGISPQWYQGTGIPDLPCGEWWSSPCPEVSWDLLRSNQIIKHNGQATSWIIKYINTKGNMIPLQHTKKSEFGFFVNLYENSFWAKQKNFRSWTEHHDEGNPGAYPWCQFCGGPVLGPSDRSLRSSLDYSAVLSTCHWTASGPVTGSAAVAF